MKYFAALIEKLLQNDGRNYNCVYSRMKDFSLLVALDDNMEAQGDLYWDDGETLQDDVKQYTFSTFHCTGVSFT